MGTQMDIQRKDAGKKRLIRRIAIGVVLVAAVAGMSVVVSRLKPAAPSVDLSVVWRDTVKRGPITSEVRGLGTLRPIHTMLLPATPQGKGHLHGERDAKMRAVQPPQLQRPQQLRQKRISSNLSADQAQLGAAKVRVD